MENWFESNRVNDDVVISSRVRLARNIKGVPFPNRMDNDQGKEAIEKIKSGFFKKDDSTSNFEIIYMWNVDELLGASFVEKHIISESLLENREKSAFIIDKEKSISIMINEEDHLRLQCISEGLNLKECYETINDVDNMLEEELEFAYDEELGYLTSCPTNIGTGLRASVMIHLPMLSRLGTIDRLGNMLSKMGMTIRGLFGEGSKGYGNIYQISNQVTLGPSEEEIIDNLVVVVNKIILEEKEAREKYFRTYRDEFEDKIMRALGLLKYSRVLSSQEALELLSYIRLGIEMNIIQDIEKDLINELMINGLSSTMQSNAGTILNEYQRNVKRAEIMRNKLK